MQLSYEEPDLKHQKLISLFLLLVIVLSLVALIHPQDLTTPDYSVSVVSQSLVQEIGFGNQNASYLNQTTRVQIYNFITGNPRTNFRGICSALALPVGVVQYHLAVLMKGGLVSSRRDGRNKRYFESKKFSDVESWMISVLRHETVKKILEILHSQGSERHGRLAQRLDISSQALTWHMSQLKEQGIVTGQADGFTVNYMIAEEYSNVIANCINILENEK